MNYRRKHITPKIRQLRKKGRFFQKPIFWIILLFAVLATAILYFYFFFPKVQVVRVEIIGNQALSASSIEGATWAGIHKQVLGIASASIFTVNKKQLQKSLLAAFPSLKEAGIQKHFFSEILVTVAEREPVAVFCGGQTECFFIDTTGVIFIPLQAIPQGMVVLRGSNGALVGEPAVEKVVIEAILAIEKSLKNNFQIELREVLISNPLVITTSERWQLHIDPAADINLQISKLNALLTDEISIASRKKLQYIYLQYKDRAYYK